MKTMHPLEERERLQHPDKARRFVWLFVLGGLLVLAGDWYLRFERYEWGKQLIWAKIGIREPAPVARPEPMFRTNRVEARRGGDLSALVGVRSFAERFEEERPAGQRITDEFGYENLPYDRQSPPDMVVIGDSFMASGTTDEMFSAALSRVLGRPIYNLALRGHGPFISLYRFIDDSRFREHPPDVLIWGFAEREVTGKAFAGMVSQLWRRTEGLRRGEIKDEAELTRRRVNWAALHPVRLADSLPNSSIIAHVGERIWNRLRFYLFRQLPPDVVVSAEPVLGEDMLFYRYHIDAIRRSEEERRAHEVGWSISYLQEYLRTQGIELVVLLIPEKEQVYRDALPVRFNPPDDPIPPSVLWDVEADLIERDIRVVNLLHVFREDRDRNVRLYWRDDTHWNTNGIAVAVREVAPHLRELIGSGAGRLE